MGDSSARDVVALPTGGGALRGIGEKFSPDLHTGTGNFTIPIALPSGRNGFHPQISLAYSTGAGNGPFGLGWALSVPGVSRKTSTGIPRYDEAADAFVLSGAEDLVAIEVIGPQTQYRPRTEGVFAEILYHRDAANSYWHVRTTDGMVSVYGTPSSSGADPATIAKPSDRTKVFAWKLTRSEDPFGNRIEYDYERDSAEVGPRHWDQIYLKRIRYIDYGSDRDTPEFLVSVEFVYDDRPDPSSEHRSGFEIRTRKRCRRILVRTHPGTDKQVRTYDLTYADERPELADRLPPNGASLLSRIDVSGHNGAAIEKLPPLTFDYSGFDPNQRDFFPLDGADLPARSLADPSLDLVDLFGNGLLDIIEMNGTVRYWRNLGGGRFGSPRFMADAPAGLTLADPGVQFVDANGDGRADLLVTRPTLAGYFPLRFGGRWDRHSFRSYAQAPTFALDDPEVKLIDLDGDGVTDAVRSGTRLECFFNDPQTGWNRTRWVDRQPLDVFPNVNFSDLRVKWGDFSGDGLLDIALVFDGNVEYWPNLGHGNWGKRIHMDSSPRFPFGYDPKRILIGDVDGDGLADIVYVDDGKVTIWINQSGNLWSDPVTIHGTPPVSDADDVRIVDILGTGISGVLWSRDTAGASRAHFWFLDFTGGRKPYLLCELDNHIGAITKVDYAPSVRFYLADEQQPDTRWKTTLPFPVHVVAAVEVIDELSKGKLTTQYRYHHGYWDGAEREFNGFGMVEQLDTEAFETYGSSGLHSDAATFVAVDRAFFSPPTLNRTWFHQGPVGDEYGDWQELDWSAEYWPGDPQMLSHTEAVNQFLAARPAGADGRRVKRDALRTLRGSTLRTELYALDGSDRENRPYTVNEFSFGLVEITAPAATEPTRRHIFFPHPVSQRTTQWERGDDPMTQLSFNRYTDDAGMFDAFGRLRGRTTIACPRGWRALTDQPAATYLATRSRALYAMPADPATYLHVRTAVSMTYEIRNTAGKRVTEIAALPDSSSDLGLIGQMHIFYDGAAFAGLPLGQVGRYGAVSRTETLVLTDEILQDAYGAAIPPYFAATGAPAWTAQYPAEFRTLLPPRAGYVFHPGSASAFDARGYFAIDDRRRYDFQMSASGIGRGLVLETLDPLHDASDPSGHRTVVEYDEYELLPTKVTDAAGLTTAATYDYRVLQATEVVDHNGNATAFTFSALGLLESSAVRGKRATEGDRTRPGVLMEYGLLAFENSPPGKRQPMFVRTTRHLHHETDVDVPQLERNETITTVEYSDGFGRLLQTRTQGDDVRFGNEQLGDGDAILPAKQTDGSGAAVTGEANTDPLKPYVLVSGWQTYDNKGQVVAKYQPFFSRGWPYDPATDETTGQKLSLFYDPRGHVVRAKNPDGSEQRVIYGVPGTIAAPDLTNPDAFEPTPWMSFSYDLNDNAGRTHPLTSTAYAHHRNTPSSTLVDGLGRTIETVERNREAVAVAGGPLSPIEELRTTTVYDIRGNVLVVTDALGRPSFHDHVYDLADRRLRLESIDAGLRVTMFDAAGGVVEQRDGRGALRLRAYDGLNRPVRLWARHGTGQALTMRQRTEYGDAGNPAQPAAQRATNRELNRLGVAARQFDEAGILTFESYDFKGNLREKARQVVDDAAILAVFNGPPAGWKIEPFTIDWTNIADVPIHPTRFVSTVTCDALNRTKLVLCPEDVERKRRTIRLHYNRAGALDRLALDDKAFVEHIVYNARGQRVMVAYGNGILTRHARDLRTFRLLRTRTEHYTTPAPLKYVRSGALLQDLAYEYDLAGNILRLQDRAPGAGIPGSVLGLDALDRVFAYDARYRLRSATGRECDRPPDVPWDDTPRCTDLTKTRLYTEQYRYDAAGNLRQLTHGASGTNVNRVFDLVAGTNRLLKVTAGAVPFGYEYNENGSLTTEGTARHFEWDHADQLRAYRTQTAGSEPSVHVQYFYDSGGQRVKKVVRKQGGQINVTVYIDGLYEYHRSVRGAAIDENNTLHVMDDRSRIAMARIGPPLPDDAAPPVTYHAADHLGSSTIVLDAAGNLVSWEEYAPYGDTTVGGVPRKRYRFNGKEREEESGLYYHDARYQAPWLARWISCDPLGPAVGMNPYVAFGANPMNRVDPTGLAERDSNAAARAEATGPTYNEQWKNDSTGPKYARVTDEGAISINGETVVAPPVTIRAQAASAPASPAPPPSAEAARPPIAELRQERWEAAKSGMQKEALDIVADTMMASNPPTGVVLKIAAHFLKPKPPKPTGDKIRDLEVQESFEGGGTVVQFAAVGVSLSPTSEIASGARMVLGKAAKSMPLVLPTAAGGLGGIVRPPARRLPGFHEHHVFPQQFRKEFAKLSIDVDAHTIQISAKKHMRLHQGGVYNWEWEQFLSGANGKPTLKGAEDLALDLLHQHNVVGPKTLTRYYSR